MQADRRDDLPGVKARSRYPRIDRGLPPRRVSEEHRLVSSCGIRVFDVDDADVHRDAADHGHAAPAKRDGYRAAETAHDALRVSARDEGDARVALRAVQVPVGDPLALQELFRGEHDARKAHRGSRSRDCAGKTVERKRIDVFRFTRSSVLGEARLAQHPLHEVCAVPPRVGAERSPRPRLGSCLPSEADVSRKCRARDTRDRGGAGRLRRRVALDLQGHRIHGL